MPVLDAPQYLQLHSALDTFSSLPFSIASQQNSSSIFWLDHEVMSAALKSVLSDPVLAEEDTRRRRIREITEEGWDIFLRVLGDGSLVVQAVAVRRETSRADCLRPKSENRTLTVDHPRSLTNLLSSKQPLEYCLGLLGIST